MVLVVMLFLVRVRSTRILSLVVFPKACAARRERTNQTVAEHRAWKIVYVYVYMLNAKAPAEKRARAKERERGWLWFECLVYVECMQIELNTESGNLGIGNIRSPGKNVQCLVTPFPHRT